MTPMINGFNQRSSFSRGDDAGGSDGTVALSPIEHLNVNLHVSTIRFAPPRDGRPGRRWEWVF